MLLLFSSSHVSADVFPNSECSTQADVALAYGNHKGAIKAPGKLFDLLDNHLTQGLNMPLPLSMARHIPGLLMLPMTISLRNRIDEMGSIVPKDRLNYSHSM